MNWKKINIKLIEDFCQKTYRRYSEYPSIRDIFYAFVGQLFPNTKSAYHGLVKLLVKKRLSGEIDWRTIRDGSGRELNKGDSEYETPNNYFDRRYNWFKNCSDNYSLPKWTNQKNIVVILCEKEADYPIVKSIVSDLNVYVGYMRGYCGKRLMFEVREELEDNPDRKLIIILLGDFDPSGSDIKQNVKRDLLKIGVDKITTTELVNVAITKEQIEKFKLPHVPEDEEEIRKLQNDPRFKKWSYGLYRVETASLRVRQPDYFDNLLRDTILQYFSNSIYEKIQRQEKRLKKPIKDLVNSVLK